MKQHKALELADAWLDRAKKEASRRNSAYDHYGMGNTPENCDPEGAAMAAELRRQHALIVQMREALRLSEDVLSHRPWSAEIWPDGTHPMRGITTVRSALTAANEYLEQP